MTVYMVRNKETGEYSNGGPNPEWVPHKRGKIWKTKGTLNQHLTAGGMISTSNHRREKARFYAEAELVEFELTEKRTEEMP